jgi:DNA-binding NtrC family response regulator
LSTGASEDTLVFVVDDERQVADVTVKLLNRAGYRARAFYSGASALEALGGTPEVAVLITDLEMPRMDGMDLLAQVRQVEPTLPVIFMTGRGTVQTAVEAMRQGAYDFLLKPIEERAELLTAVERAAQHKRLIERNAYLEHRVRLTDRFEEMVGESSAVQRVYGLVESVAPTDTTVLILGESGTGKELVARAIHRRSARANAPFVAMNSGALTESQDVVYIYVLLSRTSYMTLLNIYVVCTYVIVPSKY